MSDYDFSLLSPTDFEELCRDLLQIHLKAPLQSFTKGRDNGIDLRHAPAPGKNWIVQCKHYARTKFSTLKSRLKRDEVPKLASLRPDRYILTTSLGLTPKNVDELFEILSPHCKSPHDIISRDDLNGLIRENPEVERAHFKLWVTSEPVLSRVLHNDLFVQSMITKEEIGRRLGLYVPTKSLKQARSKLQKEKVCILSGIPGVGKTTLAEMLLIPYVEKGWQLVSLHQNITEALRLYQENPKAKQVFYYDDFLGQISTGEKLAKNEDQVLLRLMASVAQSPRKRFVLTTREYILAQARSEHERLARADLDIFRFIVSCDDYSKFEKAQILANHLFFFDVPYPHIEALVEDKRYERIVNHSNYSPRIVELMTGAKKTSSYPPEKYLDEFVSSLENPTEIWSHAFNKHLPESSKQLLLLMATLGNAVRLDDLEPRFEHYYLQRAASLGVPRTSNDFRDSLNELEGDFVRIHADGQERVVQFQNPSVIDFLSNELKQRPQDVTELLNTASVFDQVERIVFVFNLGRKGKAANDIPNDLAEILKAAIQRTIKQSGIAVAGGGKGRGSWKLVYEDNWQRLRATIRIGGSVEHGELRSGIAMLVHEHFDSFKWRDYELEAILDIHNLVSSLEWWSEKDDDRLLDWIKEYLLNLPIRDSFDGLASLASWIQNHDFIFTDSEKAALDKAMLEAIKHEAWEESFEKDPGRIGSGLEILEELSSILGEPFEDEISRMNDALNECDPPPSEENPDDWAQPASDDSSEGDIDSLFDSLL